MSQPDPKKTAMTSLEQLKASGTVVVADTGDFEAIAKFKPRFFNVQLNRVSFIDQDVTSCDSHARHNGKEYYICVHV